MAKSADRIIDLKRKEVVKMKSILLAAMNGVLILFTVLVHKIILEYWD